MLLHLMLHQQAAILKITLVTITKLRVSQPRLKTQRSEQSSKRLYGFSCTGEPPVSSARWPAGDSGNWLMVPMPRDQKVGPYPSFDVRHLLLDEARELFLVPGSRGVSSPKGQRSVQDANMACKV